MKKLLLIIAIISISYCAKAQGGGYVGPKAGLNITNLTGDDVEDAKMKVGLNVGGAVHLGFSENIGIAAEILYSMKGAGGEGDDINLSYLDIPVLFRVSFGEDTKIYVNAGPYAGILLSAKQGDIDGKDFYKSLEIGGAAGGGVMLPLAGSLLAIDLRYGTSLSTIAEKIEILSTTVEPDEKNMVISLSGILFFSLGG